MSLKDLFGKTSEQIVTRQQLDDLYQQAESEGYLDQAVEDKNRFLPAVDFSVPSNFARYGSAERYYADGFKNIYENYPYDGSKKEKLEWRNKSSQLDLYLFDNLYPRTTGYLNLDSGSVADDGTYRTTTYPQYVKVKGGPNQSPQSKFETANLYDLDTNRESNLGITAVGNTVEFWFKDNLTASNSSYDKAYALFDIWNGVTASANEYTRLVIAKENGANKFSVTYRSGSAGVTSEQLNYTFDSSTWHHYAFTFANTNTNDLQVCLYVDGNLELQKTIISGGGIGLGYNLNSIANIGALRTDIVTADGTNAGYGVSCGSFDEVRFWKIARNSQQIYRNWFVQIGGGNNTDDANKDLGIYLKFNEGIVNSVEISDLDKVCLDYSGRISNGSIINYNLNVRSTGSAFDDYGCTTPENKDPIVFSSNPLVQAVISTYTDLGYQHDVNNISNIYSSIPSWITEEAQKNDFQDLQNLIQIISSYFDTLYLQIEAVPKLKDIQYDGTSKPKPFSKNLLSGNGFENLQIFNDTTFLEDILSRNESAEFQEKIHNVKNTIYQNIYNNLSYIYKTKGTEKSLRNLIRCFGIDDELIKINMYANNVEYDLSTRYTYTSIPKKFVDFNDPDRFDGYIYQKAKVGDSNTKGYIPGTTLNSGSYIPLTVQAEVIFPKNPIIETDGHVVNDFTTVSLFGVHEANIDQNVLAWGGDLFNFQVYAIKPKVGSEDVYFKLVGSFNGESINLTSSIYKEVYANEKWNLAVRIKPENYQHANLTVGSDTPNYTVELVGINSIGDATNNQFVLSGTILNANMVAALQVNKRTYAGAHYIDFDPNQLDERTDVKISSVRFWLDYLTDEELTAHSYEANIFGRQQPNWIPAFYDSFSGTPKIPLTRMDMLALHWNFYNVSASDSNGQFIVEDVSSGSVDLAATYGYTWLNNIIRYQMPGYADEFYPSDDQVVNKEYVFSGKKQNPETLSGNDMIQVVETDDVTRTKDNRLVSYYISVEKSMAQVINDEIMNWFATIKAYNNLIGEPVERYKQEYSGLKHLRELFFSRVNNSPNFEKFLTFYKWIDSSLSMMINQLIPASANASDKVRNMVESHMLERSKYENKLPTIELKAAPKSSPVTSHLDYNYIEQAAGNVSLTQPLKVSRYYTFKPQWLKQRAIRTEDPVNTILEPQNDIDREAMRQVINHRNLDSLPTLYEIDNNSTYEGREDLTKIFTKIYKLSTDRLNVLEDAVVPVNIQNIPVQGRFIFADEVAASSSSNQVVAAKQKYNRIGNYQRVYEQVFVPGRTNNNKSFVELEGNISGSTALDVFGNVNRSLPVRQAHKNIIVERFSAPGGPEINSRGYLDAVAEEYSVYNSLNHRNSRVRKVLNAWLAESASIDPNYPSYHQVNKNVSYSPDPETNLRAADYDNWFIQHQIPQSDQQYSWITASLSASFSASAYFSEFDNLSPSTGSYAFLSQSQESAQFVNYRTSSADVGVSVNTGSNTISLPSGSNKYLSNLNGPYQGAGWKFLRNAENPLVVQSRKNNYILVQDKPTQKARIGKNKTIEYYYPTRENTFTAYREPPVSYNKPIEQKIKMSGSTQEIELVSTYDNNKKYFSNDNLSVRAEIAERAELQTYDVVKTLEKDSIYEPKPVVTQVTYETQLFPAKDKTGLKETRTKPYYAETSGTGSNGYDRNTGEIRSFWRNSLENRKRTNAYESATLTGSLNALNLGQISASHTASQFAGIARYSSSWKGATYTLYPYITSSEDYSSVHDTVFSTDNDSDLSVSLSKQTVSTNDYISLKTNIYSASYGELAGLDEFEARQVFALPSGSYVYTPITKSSNETYLQERFVYDASYNLLRPKASYAYKIHYPSITSNWSTTAFMKYLVNVGMPFNTPLLAGKNPWYDSYEQYFEDLRPYSLNHTILPEFNFSENDEYYLKTKNGDVKSLPPENYISFVGTDANVNSINNAYNITDKINNFVFNDYDGKKKLKLTIDGIKKLLPYKGFYPQERSAQLVSLFQKSYWNISMNDIVNGYPTYNGFTRFNPTDDVAIPEGLLNGDIAKSGSALVSQMQTLLQPYFAPGILFNSFKAGIAMDWPTVSTSSARDQNYISNSQGPVYGPFVDFTSNVQFNYPVNALKDSNGNIFVNDQGNYVIRKIQTNGRVSTFAGKSLGYVDSSDPTDARFSDLWQGAYDSAGNMYVADADNAAVRQITPAGIVSTLAGGKLYDTAKASAKFSYPYGIAYGVDPLYTYIADTDNHCIRIVDRTTNEVLTLAGRSEAGFKDGNGSAARFNNPTGLAYDSTNNYLYVCDSGNHSIRRIDVTTGDVITVAGFSGLSGSNTSGRIPNLSVKFNRPTGIVYNSGGDKYLYITDTNNHCIYRVDPNPSGDTTLSVGLCGTSGYANGEYTNARFNYPTGIALDSTNNYLTICDTENQRIRLIDISSPKGVASLFAGDGTIGYSDNNDRTLGKFNHPFGIISSSLGFVITEISGNHIRYCEAGTIKLKTLAATGSAGYLDNATGTDAKFNAPAHICIDDLGTTLYLADVNNHRIRGISTAGAHPVTTYAGVTTYGSASGTGQDAQFGEGGLRGCAIDSLNNLYVSDIVYHSISKINVSTGVVTKIAGTSSSGSVDNAIGLSASFNEPYYLAANSLNNLYIADRKNNAIRLMTTASNNPVTTFAGGIPGQSDGVGTEAEFNLPRGIAIDSNNIIYVDDTDSHTVRKITTSAVVTTVAGADAGSPGMQNGLADTEAFFNTPIGIYSSGSNLYIADAANNRIRKFDLNSNLVSTVAGSSTAGLVNSELYTASPFFYGTSSFASSSNNQKIYVLDDANLTRIPFESILDLRGYSQNDTLYYLDPTRVSTEGFSDTQKYSSSYDSSAPQSLTRYNPQFGFENKNAGNNQTRKFSDSRYQLAINNFLAEIPRFFLQNGSLTSFTSTKAVGELVFVPGRTYEMSIVIEKDKDLKMILDAVIPDYLLTGSTLKSQIISAASTFGPPTKYFSYSTGSDMELGHVVYDSPAYAPYAPPYYYGPQQIKLSFTPENKTYGSYEEIINALTVSCEPVNTEITDYFSSSIKQIGGDYTEFEHLPSYSNRMPLSSSLNFNLIVPNSQNSYDDVGNVSQVTNTQDQTLNYWRIQTKFESPILNFNTDANNNLLILDTSNQQIAGSDMTITSSVTKFGFTGLWSGYAQTSSAGVSLSIVPGINSKKNNKEDLASKCGFALETKQIGKIAATKQISEAIVMIPFTKKINHRVNKSDKIDSKYAKTIKEVLGENGKTSSANTNGPYYFEIDPLVINKVLEQENINIDITDRKIPYSDIKKALSNKNPSNTILSTMKAMTNYVLPPHLDWVYNKNIEPFVMYVFEFNHELNGSELADIWQGVMPESAMKAVKSSVNIEHNLDENEFFHGKKLPDDIQWKVFKVKRRANYTYNSLIDPADDRFKFGKNNETELVYSYNWPYDYFSLVELVNIEASLEVKTNTSGSM